MGGFFNRQEQAPTRSTELASRLVCRLPRMIAITSVALMIALGGLLLVPTTYQARLTLALPPTSEPADEIEHVLSQTMLADIVSRLPTELAADLRGSGGDALDTTAMIRRRLTLTPTGGTELAVLALGDSASNAATLATAVAASYSEATAQLQPVPGPTPTSAPTATASAGSQVAESAEANLLRQRISLAWESRVRLEEKAKRITRQLASGNFTALALEANPLPVLGRLLEELTMLESEREALAVTLLPNHPSMRNVQERIATMRTQLSTQAQALVRAIREERDAAQSLEDELKAEYEELQAMAASGIDTGLVTGAIDKSVQPVISALPPPVRGDLALAAVGSFAFFGQIGLVILGKPRQRRDPGLALSEDYVGTDSPAGELPEFEAAEAAMSDSTDDSGLKVVHADSPAAPENPRVVAIVAHGDITRIRICTRRMLDSYEVASKNVVLIDAASRRRGHRPGVSDLSLGLASFGDVLLGSGTQDAALIPWGKQARFRADAPAVRTLLLALSALYDVVIVMLRGNEPGIEPLLRQADVVIPADHFVSRVPIATAAPVRTTTSWDLHQT